MTTHMRDELLYSSLRVLYILLVHEEITFCGGTFDLSLSIKALVVILKGIGLAAQNEKTFEQTGNIDPTQILLRVTIIISVNLTKHKILAIS